MIYHQRLLASLTLSDTGGDEPLEQPKIILKCEITLDEKLIDGTGQWSESAPEIFVYFTTVLEILLSNIAYFGLDLREWLHLVAISYSGVRNLNLFPFCFQRKSNRENEDEANTQSNAFILLDNSSSLSKTKKLGFYSIFR